VARRVIATDAADTVPTTPLTSAHSDACEPIGYRRLAELLGVLLAEQHVDAVLKRIAETLRQLVRCDDLVIWEALSADQLRPALVEGRDAEQLERLQIRIGEGITGQACLLREPICSNRADLDERAGHVPGTDAEPEAIVCLPLLARSELLGALSLYRSGFDGFTDSEFELIRHFAEVAALALANARSQAELAALARTDDLTGLANRRHLKELLGSELARATHLRRPLSLLLLDLDDFKQINDSQGHHAGDMALRAIADILAGSLRQQDVAARLGGDEFALLLPNTDNDQAQTVNRRLVEVVHAQTGVHISTGIATFASDSVTDLLRVADRNLYKSKGRNQPRRGRRAHDAEGATATIQR
jgi:diguanylate cyclase (GGDEF)-like protein